MKSGFLASLGMTELGLLEMPLFDNLRSVDNAAITAVANALRAVVALS
jgi:hypothetical protein